MTAPTLVNVTRRVGVPGGPSPFQEPRSVIVILKPDAPLAVGLPAWENDDVRAAYTGPRVAAGT